jgi:hypothetical protein
MEAGQVLEVRVDDPAGREEPTRVLRAHLRKKDG